MGNPWSAPDFMIIDQTGVISYSYLLLVFNLWCASNHRLVMHPGLPRWGTPTPEVRAPIYYYRPQRSCGQGYVFTCICDSVHRGGICLSACWDTTPLPRRPPCQGHPPAKETPCQVDPSAKDPPRRRHTPSAKETPAPRHMVNERPVRILLECIIVWHIFCRKLHENERDWT